MYEQPLHINCSVWLFGSVHSKMAWKKKENNITFKAEGKKTLCNRSSDPLQVWSVPASSTINSICDTGLFCYHLCLCQLRHDIINHMFYGEDTHYIS